MPIFPLPQFEADLKADQEALAALKPPKTVVVRFGRIRNIAELAFDLNLTPGCGSKLVCRTHRGTELGEMLTTTCENSGCSKSVSRQEMLEYIERSGGRDFPFFTEGRVLRLATPDDLQQQERLDATIPGLVRDARLVVDRLGLPMKVVDAEPILGGERLTFYFVSEERVDFRPAVMELAGIHRARIELRQIGARDEARLTADYERCGQHCCCRQFLKVLKPVSMKQAKIQKATLDPLKISGRCGRLMCCLRYEEQSYDELRARLPRKNTRVRTPDGAIGYVLDAQILTQLVLVKLEDRDEDPAAYPLESLVIEGPPQARGPRPRDDDDEPANTPQAGPDDGPPTPRGPGPGPGAGPGPGPGPRTPQRNDRRGGERREDDRRRDGRGPRTGPGGGGPNAGPGSGPGPRRPDDRSMDRREPGGRGDRRQGPSSGPGPRDMPPREMPPRDEPPRDRRPREPFPREQSPRDAGDRPPPPRDAEPPRAEGPPPSPPPSEAGPQSPPPSA